MIMYVVSHWIVRYLFPIIILVTLSSCAINITPQAISGSKSDGTVTFAYEYGLFDKPIVNWADSNKIAIQRCKAWGYKNAEPFNSAQENCLVRNGYGDCTKEKVTLVYQCTNR